MSESYQKLISAMLDTSLPTYLREKARDELHEKGDSSQELCQFRSLIQEELTDLTCPLDDKFLIRFLRAGKFHMEKSLKLLRQYYVMKKDNPSLFEKLAPQYLTSSFDKQLQIVLKSRDTQGRHVFIFRAGVWDPNEVHMDDIFRCNYLFMEEMTSFPETQINGITAVVDFQGFSFLQIRHFTPKHALRMVQVIQGNFPIRFQEIHLVFQPYIFHLVFTMVKPMFSEKIRNRIHIHGSDLESFHQFLDPNILPDFLGGQNYNWEEERDEFVQSMMDKNQQYEDMCQYGFRISEP